MGFSRATIYRWARLWLPPIIVMALRRVRAGIHVRSAVMVQRQTAAELANTIEEKLAEAQGSEHYFLDERKFLFDLDHPYQLSKVSVFFPFLDGFLPTRPRPVVVDVGCGQGFSLCLILERYPHLKGLGFDISPHTGMMQRRHGLKGLYLQADAEHIPLQDGAADVVTMIAVLHHFYRYPQRTLSEARRVLKPGGALLLIDPNGEPGDAPGVRQAVEQIQKQVACIAELLRSLLPAHQREAAYYVLSREVHSQTEAPLSSRAIEAYLSEAGFRIEQKGFANYSTWELRNYGFGWDIGEAVDRYLAKLAPQSGVQTWFVGVKPA